ncbi:SCO family protein [Labrys neptuniae]
MSVLTFRSCLIGGAALVALAAIGTWQLWPSEREPVGSVGGPFILTDSNGRSFGFGDLQGKPSLVYFGFTHCPDICPTTLFLLAEVMKELGAGADAINAVFITVDPERDTPEQMKNYLAAFDPRLRGLTGTPAQLGFVQDIYGVEAEILPGASKNYNIDHTDTVFVLDRNGRFRSSFDLRTQMGDVVGLLKSVMDHGKDS